MSMDSDELEFLEKEVDKLSADKKWLKHEMYKRDDVICDLLRAAVNMGSAETLLQNGITAIYCPDCKQLKWVAYGHYGFKPNQHLAQCALA